ncbi:MAG TPA: glycine C-acetyltransferase [Terriglobales bacterium]
MSRPQMQYLNDELKQLEAKGLRSRLRVLEGEQLPVAVFDGRRVINLSSNNYLGLCTHPALREAALRATRELGVGAGAVRTISGTMAIHMQLEAYIAGFKQTQASVVFQSGFTANAGTVGAIMGRNDFIVSDELNHASIIDGARLSRATIKVFPHKDCNAAEAILKELAPQPGRKLLITDGVFSMDGDIAPLPDLCTLAEKYGAVMMVDDAHSSGVLGKNGRGTVDHFGLHGRVDVQVGTLSKAIGALGGYVAGDSDLIEFLHLRGRPFLFSTGHPPAVAASCLAAFQVLEQEPERIQRMWDNTRFFKDGLKKLGFNTGASETPITPIMVGDGRKAMEFSRALFQAGLFVTGLAFPTVPEGKARLRTIVTATHTEPELAEALGILEKVGKQQGLI